MYYKPYWFCEFHIGLKKHLAVLDATNSKVQIDMEVFNGLDAQDQVPLDELSLDKRQGFKRENILPAKIKNTKEASNLIGYKLKYIYPDKDIFLSEPYLMNIPTWKFKIKEKVLTVFGNDTNYKKTVLEFLKKNTSKKKKTKTQLFTETLNQIKKPKYIFDDFVKVVKTTNKWILIIVVIIVLFTIYFIISKIVENISTLT